MTRSEAKQLGIAHGLEVGKNADFTKEELADEDSFKEAALDAEMNARQYAGYTDRLEGRSDSTWEAYDEGVGIGIDRAWKRRQASAAFDRIESERASEHKSWNQRQREKIIAKADRKPMQRAGLLPPIYVLDNLVVTNSRLLYPQFPIMIHPTDGRVVFFSFFSSKTYEAHTAFGSRVNARILGIEYRIIVGMEPNNSKQFSFKHDFVTEVRLSLTGLQGKRNIMKPYGQLEGLPVLPKDYQYFQFIN